MGQLIRLPTEIRKCPVGKLAFHPKYGVCNVIGANGFARQLEYGQAIVSVDVRQCRSIDPRPTARTCATWTITITSTTSAPGAR